MVRVRDVAVCDTAKVGTVTGTAIAFGAETEFRTANTVLNSLVSLSATDFVVAYEAANPAVGLGQARVGTLGDAASLTAPTPAAYGSAAAGTKVAFVGWLRSPSA